MAGILPIYSTVATLVALNVIGVQGATGYRCTWASVKEVNDMVGHDFVPLNIVWVKVGGVCL